MKNLVINQKFGIGDVIFSMSAIRALKSVHRANVLWPVIPEYVEGLTRAYPDIIFLDFNLVNLNWNRKDRYESGNLDVIPLCHQDVPLIDCMKNKYNYFNMDWRQWKRNACYDRHFPHEISLIRHLGIEEGEKYNLLNTRWGCHSAAGFKSGTYTADLQGHGDNGLRCIYMDAVPGYSLFDWSTVIERATNIFTVSTSLLYLLELLHLSAKEVHLYCRKPREKDFRNVDYIFSKNYQLHY